MTFDFGLLIILILMIFFFTVGLVMRQGIFFILVLPMILYMIIALQALADPTLPTIGLSGFAILDVIMIWFSFKN